MGRRQGWSIGARLTSLLRPLWRGQVHSLPLDSTLTLLTCAVASPPGVARQEAARMSMPSTLPFAMLISRRRFFAAAPTNPRSRGSLGAASPAAYSTLGATASQQ